LLQEFDPDAEFEVRERNLPHWRQRGASYFVTFRLGDSLPQAALAELRDERQRWLNAHPKPRSKADTLAFQLLFSEKIEAFLAAGFGACWLQRPVIWQIVEDALAHFDGSRYALGDFVIMPNHVHAIVTPLGEDELSPILHSWKSYTANRINEAVQRTGALWQRESFDHLIRDADELLGCQRYIAENPAKAGLPPGKYRLQSSVG
jgi:REP element-mobilizing transposase RayT